MRAGAQQKGIDRSPTEDPPSARRAVAPSEKGSPCPASQRARTSSSSAAAVKQQAFDAPLRFASLQQQVPERTHSPCDVVRKNQGNHESRLPCRRLSAHGRLFGEDPGSISPDKRFSRRLW
nr:uncharacterized protein LOC126518306 [Dermacentor andersoni]